MSWNVIQAGATEHPNVVEGREMIPGGPSVAWIEDVRDEYGEDSPYYVARVLAEFPKDAEESAFQLSWLLDSEKKHAEGWFSEDLEKRVVVAVDPARHGPDATVLAARQGRVVHPPIVWRGLDTMQTVERVLQEVHRLMDDRGPVQSVYVDEIGLGAGVLDRLKETLPKITYWHRTGNPYNPDFRRRRVEAKGFNSAKKAERPERFANLRAQAFWHLRGMLERGEIALPGDEKLREELRQTRVQYTADGRTQMESKDDLKGRLGRSPDRADAVAMTLRPLLTGHRQAWFR